MRWLCTAAQGGEADLNNVCKKILQDYQRGRIPFFVAPPFDDDQPVETVRVHSFHLAVYRSHVLTCTCYGVVEYAQKDGKAPKVEQLFDKIAVRMSFSVSDAEPKAPTTSTGDGANGSATASKKASDDIFAAPSSSSSSGGVSSMDTAADPLLALAASIDEDSKAASTTSSGVEPMVTSAGAPAKTNGRSRPKPGKAERVVDWDEVYKNVNADSDDDVLPPEAVKDLMNLNREVVSEQGTLILCSRCSRYMSTPISSIIHALVFNACWFRCGWASLG